MTVDKTAFLFQIYNRKTTENVFLALKPKCFTIKRHYQLDIICYSKFLGIILSLQSRNLTNSKLSLILLNLNRFTLNNLPLYLSNSNSHASRIYKIWCLLDPNVTNFLRLKSRMREAFKDDYAL